MHPSSDVTQVSSHRRAQNAKRKDLEVTLMIAALTFASVIAAFAYR